MNRGLRGLALAGLPVALLAGPLSAQELKIGLASEPTSIDPHFHMLGPNNAMRRHIFESLVTQNAELKIEPGLAASWRTLDDTTWEFKLRPNVKFSNGTELTAKDVIYTFCRIPTVENSPSSFTFAVRAFTSVEAPDPLTLVIKTAGPQPLVPNNLATVGIISAQLNGGENVKFRAGGCEGLGTPPKSADFNDPAKAVGTGPFRLANYTRGTSIVLERNESYWGAAPHWQRVTFRPMSSQGARVAGLLAGDVDFIENPPIQDFERIKGAGYQIAEGLSNRIIYVQLDQYTDPAWKTPGVRGTDGKNPFLDKRVRAAVSKAINRQAIVERIMGGHAVAAGELLPYPLFGTTKDFPVEKYDPEAAKKLLAEAGYPNGFELTLGTPNDRYINDEKIAQAVAQMLTRVGIKTGVDAMTASTFFSRRNKFEFSAYLAGWGADSGELSNSMNSLVVTLQPDKGLGPTNRGRYSNHDVDELVIKAMATVDDAAREKLLQEASRVAMSDYGIIPLHFEVTPWAFRKGLNYRPRVDQYTLAFEVQQVGS
jgi:peptide/nickel transport system substrate-binding protein